MIRPQSAPDSVAALVRQAEQTTPASQALELPEGFAVYFNNAPAPLDEATGTLYLPQSADQAQWQGTLSTNQSTGGYILAFLPDEAFADKASAIAQGHAFTLQVSRGDAGCTYRVVFTGLPVLTLNTDGQYEEPGRIVNQGRMALFENDSDAVTQLPLEYWMRGRTSSNFEKKSFRLALKDGTGEKYKTSLLDMRQDDDWILNAMYTDPNKLREKLCQELWQRMVEQNGTALPMSEMAYVEVVQDGRYAGLYGLQVPVDAKLLGIDGQNEALYKISMTQLPLEVEWLEAEKHAWIPGIEQKWPQVPGRFAELWQPLKDYYDLFRGGQPVSLEQAAAVADVGSMMDNYCLIQFVYAWDNDMKNYYLALQDTPEGPRLSRVLWDLDFSFGQMLDEEEPDAASFSMRDVYETANFGEMYQLLQDPEAWALLCERWAQLRRGALDLDWTLERAAQLADGLEAAGALARDSAAYPAAPSTADISQLEEFMRQRVPAMDALFQPEK